MPGWSAHLTPASRPGHCYREKLRDTLRTQMQLDIPAASKWQQNFGKIRVYCVTQKHWSKTDGEKGEGESEEGEGGGEEPEGKTRKNSSSVSM